MHFVLKKIGYGLIVLLGVAVFVFMLFQGLGDPSRLLLGQRSDSNTQKNIRAELYLDQPRFIQLVYYINDVSPIALHTTSDIKSKQLKGFFVGGKTWKIGIKVPYLRRSYQTKKDVSSMLIEAIPGTLLLASAAMFIAIIVGILLGVLSSIRPFTWIDRTALLSSIMGISAPSFFIGIIVSYLFGVVFSNITGLHMNGSWRSIDPFTGPYISLNNLILPAITLGIRPLAIITQLTRASMLDVLQLDYIRTAKAKGLPTQLIIWKHAFKNAINPVITAVTGWFAELLAGSFFVESIFGWKGIGKLTVDALEKLDFPVVMGAVLFSACCFVLINTLSDILYALMDPRIALRN